MLLLDLLKGNAGPFSVYDGTSVLVHIKAQEMMQIIIVC